MSQRTFKFVPIVILAALTVMESRAHAAFVLNLTQIGNNVEAAGAGTLNVSALSLNATGVDTARTRPVSATLVAGPVLETPAQRYLQLSGPINFGSGVDSPAMAGSGDLVGIVTGNLEVPSGYISGSPLSDSDTYFNTTLASLGATPGTYVYTWGSGTAADSFTINIGVVPEPATFATAGVPAAIALLRRRRRGIVAGAGKG